MVEEDKQLDIVYINQGYRVMSCMTSISLTHSLFYKMTWLVNRTIFPLCL